MSNSDSKRNDDSKKIFHFKKESIHLKCEWGDCQDAFPTMQSFLNHMQYHMERQPWDDLKCMWRDCGHLMSTQNEFIIHTNYHAFHTKIKSFGENLVKRKNLSECSLNVGTRNIIPELPETFICSFNNCKLSFPCPESYYLHVNQHVPSGDGAKCLWEGCDMVAANGYKLRDHLRSHTQEKLVACPKCGGLFSNRTKFLDHVKRQGPAEEQVYKCSYCSKKLTSERLLRDHIRNHINHYKCPFCEMTCCSPSNLSNHIKYRHDTNRPHACNYCDYSGKSQRDLCKHLETHLSEPQHKCHFENCNYVTRSSHCLKFHLMKQHKKEEIAVYICHICKKEFTRGTYLTRHLFKQHAFRWPSGHSRFRYKRSEDGHHELQTVRYESIELIQENSVDGNCEEVDAMVEEDNNDKELSIDK